MASDGRTTADVIPMHVSALISGMLAQSAALHGLQHRATKGKLRELLLWDLLAEFLPRHLALSSGIIVSASGEPHKQSNQSDIVIYDGRLIPPFIRRREIGIIPAASAVAVVEVKSNLTRGELAKAEQAAERTVTQICAGIPHLPIMCVFGFQGLGPEPIRQDGNAAKAFLREHANHLAMIALAGRFSWIRYPDEGRGATRAKGALSGWVFGAGNQQTHEEVKRFVAVLLDNCRTVSERRMRAMTGSDGQPKHHDWLSKYIRDR